jgi:cob(I)alamin adenosyltransferase
MTIATGGHDVVVLDEITYAMTWGWIGVGDVVAAIGARPEHVSIVITGRDAPAEIVGLADTVTEHANVKHAFDDGVKAKKGIDF